MKNQHFGAAVGKMLLAAAATLLAGQANAAVITDNVTFSITNFTSQYGDPVPVDPVKGGFTISFDPTQTYTDDSADITLTSLNIVLGSALSFDYSPTGNISGLAGQLVVGGISNSAAEIYVSPSSDDFYLHIDKFATAPALTGFGYSQTSAGLSSFYYFTSSADSSLSVSPATAAVPEPASWIMMLAGFGIIGFCVRRRTKAAVRVSYI